MHFLCESALFLNISQDEDQPFRKKFISSFLLICLYNKLRVIDPLFQLALNMDFLNYFQ